MLSISMVLVAEQSLPLLRPFRRFYSKWHPLEMNENLKESVAVIDVVVNELMPHVLMGTSLRDLYVMHADSSEVPWGVIAETLTTQL